MAIEDTTKLIWDDVFLVRVPLLASMSVEEIKTYGIRTSGVKAFDDNLDKQWTRIGINIDKMVGLFNDGVTIYVLDGNDRKIIYDHISKHINAWKEQLERGINVGNAPIDDLILMDQFAQEIYSNAKHQLTPDYLESIIGRKFMDVQRIGQSNFFKKDNRKPSQVIQNQKDVKTINGAVIINPLPDEDNYERNGLADFFKGRQSVNLR